MVTMQQLMASRSQEDKESYLFKGFGKKLQSKYKRLMLTLPHRSPSPPPTANPVSEGKDRLFDKCLMSGLFEMPFYFTQPSPSPTPNKCPAPLIFTLLSVHVSIHSDDLLSLSFAYGRSMKWTVLRRIVDIYKLHFMLNWRHVHDHHCPAPPKFPLHVLMGVDVSLVQRYLNDLLCGYGMVWSVEICEFVEVSSLSIQLALPHHQLDWTEKAKEGYLKCRIVRNAFGDCFIRYQTQWFVLQPSFIVILVNNLSLAISDIIFCDRHFHLGVEGEFASLHPMRVTLHTGSKSIQLKAKNRALMSLFLHRFREMAVDSVWSQQHRFSSFAPIRKIRGSDVEWLIDGKAYFHSLVNAIESARREIFIHGWWVSPELYLIRPSSHRLDTLLKRKAEQGVKVYIVVFKEITISLSINSMHTKVALQKLHPNIRVQRHPDHYTAGVLYWAHHEKMVIVDQSIAYIGGLDLCFGRFDSPDHPIVDIQSHQNVMWAGLDYTNPRVREIRTVTHPEVDALDRLTIPRMPWHDVQAKFKGQIARDLSRHFIQRWNFVKSNKAMHKEFEIPFLLPDDFEEVPGVDHLLSAQLVRSISPWSMGLPMEKSVYDCIVHIISSCHRFLYIENQFLISTNSSARFVKNRLLQSLIERIVQAENESSPFHVFILLPLMPAFEAPLDRPEAAACRIIMHTQNTTIRSLLSSLKSHGITDHSKYLSLLSLRKYGRLEGLGLVTEQLYIHSKVIMADDRIGFIGSANLNDRSLLGSRDSEIGCFLEDGRSDQANTLSALRKQLFAEHLGLEESDPLMSIDPTNEQFVSYVQSLASANTLAYRKLFHCIPDSTVLNWANYQQWSKYPKNLSEAMSPEQFSALQSIKGGIVEYPLWFMAEEDLSAIVLTKEVFLPIDVFI